MDYFLPIASILLVYFLAVSSPGADFVVVCRNSLAYSAKTGMFTALGIAAGNVVHIVYSLAGLALIISKTPVLLNGIKFLGAGYFLYIGIQALFSEKVQVDFSNKKNDTLLKPAAALRMGFLTTMLNPKATIFFLSLFSTRIPFEWNISIKILIAAIMVFITFSWFTFLALFLNQKIVRRFFEKRQNAINKILGIVLIILAVAVFF